MEKRSGSESGIPGDPTGSSIDEHAVVDALESILTSSTFRAAPRARDLISFVVTETIAGRGHLINERTISRLALGRPESIDTRTDASARVQARRSRDLLDRYYADEGRRDPLRITIPIGQYAATFVPAHDRPPSDERRPPPSRTTGGPTVAVAQLRHRSGGVDRRVAAGLTESLVQVLSRFPGLTVVGPIASSSAPGRMPDVLAIADRSRAEYVLHGGVTTTHEVVRVTAHLSVGSTGDVRWSETFEHDVEEFAGFSAEDDVLARVAAAVGDFGGVVFREPFEPHEGRGDPLVAEALRRYYTYLDELTPDIAPQVVDDLENALRVEPHNAHLLASLGFTHAVDVLMRGVSAVESMAEAAELGRRSLAEDPSNAVAHNVLGIVALARAHHPKACAHAEAALDLAPYHPGNAYVAGMILGAADDWHRGIEIIRRVVRVNPYGPNHRHTLLAIASLMEGDQAQALAEASLLHFPGFIYGPVVRAVCLAQLDLLEEVKLEIDNVLELCPSFFDDPAGILGAAPTIPTHAAEFLGEGVAPLAELATR